MSKTLDQTSLLDLVPDSIKRDKSVSSAGKALDPLLQEVTAALDLPSIYVSIDGLSSEQLDHLAYAWDASVWRDSWPIELKRSVVKNVVTEKRKKGTVRAVRDALASIQSAATIKEWWETDPKGTPHTFTIYATLGKIEGVLDAEMQEDLIRLIDDAKPVRSHYTFVIQQQVGGGLGMCAYLDRSLLHGSAPSQSLLLMPMESSALPLVREPSCRAALWQQLLKGFLWKSSLRMQALRRLSTARPRAQLPSRSQRSGWDPDATHQANSDRFAERVQADRCD